MRTEGAHSHLGTQGIPSSALPLWSALGGPGPSGQMVYPYFLLHWSQAGEGLF